MFAGQVAGHAKSGNAANLCPGTLPFGRDTEPLGRAASRGGAPNAVRQVSGLLGRAIGRHEAQVRGTDPAGRHRELGLLADDPGELLVELVRGEPGPQRPSKRRLGALRAAHVDVIGDNGVIWRRVPSRWRPATVGARHLGRGRTAPADLGAEAAAAAARDVRLLKFMLRACAGGAPPSPIAPWAPGVRDQVMRS